MKKWFVFMAFIILTGGICYIMLVPETYQKEITINAPLLRLYKQISVIDNYAKWYNAFSDTAGITVTGKDRISNSGTNLQITTLNERSCVLKISSGSNSADILYSITADTVNKNRVTLLYKITLWKKLFGDNIIFSEAEKSLSNLKAYTEDTKKVYGFPISLTLVTDTTFLFSSKTVAVQQKQQSIKELYQLLTGYAATKDAGYTGTNIFYITAEANDSVHLYQGIGISKNVMQLPLYGPVSVKRMPYQKNLVVADYKGKFSDVTKVFDAMEQFSIDAGMTSMAIPFLKFEPGEKNFADDETINVKAYFPVR